MLRHAIKILLFAAVVSAVMLAVRLLLIQPDEMAAACLNNPEQWLCTLRDLAIKGFVYRLYGYVSIGAALLAWLSGWRALAIIAIVAGVAGASLYDFELSALGLLLGASSLMRQLNRSALAEQQAAAQ